MRPFTGIRTVAEKVGDERLTIGPRLQRRRGRRQNREDLDRLETCRHGGVAVQVLVGQLRVGQLRDRAARRQVRHRYPYHRHARIGDELWRQVRQVLGDEDDQVVALLERGKERPAVQRHNRGAIGIRLEGRISGRSEGIGILEHDRGPVARDQQTLERRECLVLRPSRRQVLARLDPRRPLREVAPGRHVIGNHGVLGLAQQYITEKRR